MLFYVFLYRYKDTLLFVLLRLAQFFFFVSANSTYLPFLIDTFSVREIFEQRQKRKCPKIHSIKTPIFFLEKQLFS